MSAFDGLLTAIVTPYAADGSVDEDALRRHVEFQIEGGVDGLVHRTRLTRVPQQGETFEVRILSVDPSARRVELQPADAPPPEPDESAEVRAALATQGSGSMGTLGDLLGAYKDKLTKG